MTEPLFHVGDKVKARREARLLMTVRDVAEPGTQFIEERGYYCAPMEEHAAGHGRGRMTRWFREDDLNAA